MFVIKLLKSLFCASSRDFFFYYTVFCTFPSISHFDKKILNFDKSKRITIIKYFLLSQDCKNSLLY